MLTIMDASEIRQKSAFVVAGDALCEVISQALRELGVVWQREEHPERGLEMLRSTIYDIILIEGNGDKPLRTNTVYQYLTSLPMAQRRDSMIVLIGSSFKTLNALEGFAYSAHLVINDSDMSNLGPILKKSWSEFEQFYRVFKTVQGSNSHEG
jgi:hypothetical protein